MTYEDLDWIHPDLCTYRYRYNYDDDEHQLHIRYKDEDSPVILDWYLLVSSDDRELRESTLKQNYGQELFYRPSIIVYDYFCDTDYYDYRGPGGYCVLNLKDIREAESRRHQLYCLEWDFKTGKKDPTEYLFNKDEEIRLIAAKCINDL